MELEIKIEGNNGTFIINRDERVRITHREGWIELTGGALESVIIEHNKQHPPSILLVDGKLQETGV